MRWLFKRWWFWAGTGFMLVAVVAGYLLIPVEEDRISQANCDRIQLGMDFAEVRFLLGGHYQFHNGCVVTWSDEADEDSASAIIIVTFKPPTLEQVIRKEFRPLPLYERIKRRVERRIRALWP